MPFGVQSCDSVQVEYLDGHGNPCTPGHRLYGPPLPPRKGIDHAGESDNYNSNVHVSEHHDSRIYGGGDGRDDGRQPDGDQFSSNKFSSSHGASSSSYSSAFESGSSSSCSSSPVSSPVSDRYTSTSPIGVADLKSGDADLKSGEQIQNQIENQNHLNNSSIPGQNQQNNDQNGENHNGDFHQKHAEKIVKVKKAGKLVLQFGVWFAGLTAPPPR
jgi:hypothetical protein